MKFEIMECYLIPSFKAQGMRSLDSTYTKQQLFTGGGSFPVTHPVPYHFFTRKENFR